ncbi:MAG: hypothetical protein HQ512_11580 [Rhodospirillales bacterium]|nr:hypothetical protein [Rhodospirillales bacterium]
MALSSDTIQDFILVELEQFRIDGQIPMGSVLTKDTKLFGSGGVLKSRPLVELMLAIEDHVEASFGKTFDWTSDKAMSANNSPFRNIASLADFVVETSTG